MVQPSSGPGENSELLQSHPGEHWGGAGGRGRRPLDTGLFVVSGEGTGEARKWGWGPLVYNSPGFQAQELTLAGEHSPELQCDQVLTTKIKLNLLYASTAMSGDRKRFIGIASMNVCVGWQA